MKGKSLLFFFSSRREKQGSKKKTSGSFYLFGRSLRWILVGKIESCVDNQWIPVDISRCK